MSVKEKKMGRDMAVRAKWEKERTKRIVFYLHKENEKEVLEHLEKQPNKRRYLIELIREDMKK